MIALTSTALIYSATVEARGFGILDRAAAGLATAREVDAWVLAENSANGLYLLAYLGGAIAFFAWLSRAVENVPALGGGLPAFSPRAAIGWWFVPFANLVQGYRIVADLWRRMARTPGEAATAVILVWWLLWLGSTLVARGLTAFENSGSVTFESLRGLVAAAVLTPLAAALSGVILIWIIREAERRIATRALDQRAVISALPVAVPGQAVAPSTAAIRYCPTCGAPRLEGASFCGSCGRDLRESDGAKERL